MPQDVNPNEAFALGELVILKAPYDTDLEWMVMFMELDKMYLFREDDRYGVQTMIAHRSLLELARPRR